ncbi:MAG: hypothetical protein LBI66_11345 [Burkholderiaceae bacterium]|nr:hypothetical protein [Burkholderiaceae bacterium]
MTTTFVRPALPARQHGAPARQTGACGPATPAQMQAQMQGPQATPLQEAMRLDLQTSWPTHRIRSFLSLQPR